MDVLEKIKNGEYQSKLDLPIKNAKTFPCPSCQIRIIGHSGAAFCSMCGTKVEGIWEDMCGSYQTRMNDFRADGHRLMELFQKDAMEEVGLANHPNAKKIYQYAYEKGHSSGLQEIYRELDDISELFK